MTRFNKRPSGLIVANQPIVSTANPTARTGNSAPGFTRDAEGELFLLAVSNFVGQDMHYEKGVARDARFKSLVAQVAVSNPEWMNRFLPWLRNEANMRTASLVAAVETVRAQLKAPGGPITGFGRALINSVLTRADEPGEMLGYWKATYPGEQIPKPIKRGIADAVARLYTERNTLKYDTASHGFRFGDVLELTHAAPDKGYQRALFKHLIDRRHGRGGTSESYVGLPMIIENMRVRSQVDTFGNHEILLRSDVLKAAGMTWEDALSLAGNKLPKNQLWEALIPNMGYMALLRNLRNFDEAGVSDKTATWAGVELASPEKVAHSRQLPMRFLSAFRSVSNVRWHVALEHALQASLNNIPEFKGRTLILIDTSGSMSSQFGKDTQLCLWDAAAIFGCALAQRCESANVVSFSNLTKPFPLPRGESLILSVDRFRKGYFLNGGTDTEGAVRTHFHGHDRVVILTDEQANHHSALHVASSVPIHIPVITFNLAGYRVGHAPSGTPTRITIGGLSDQAFKLLPVLESRAKGQWPF
jgi:hypothetical protein